MPHHSYSTRIPRAGDPVARPSADSADAKERARRRTLIALFAVYLALLIWVVLWKLEPPHVGLGGSRPVKLIPFIAAGGDAASAPLEVLANLLLFLPFGAYLRLLAPSCGRLGSAVLAAAVSLGLECTQFALAIGSFDTTDIIVNALGGLVGFALAGLIASARERNGRPQAEGRSLAVVTRWCALATAAAVLAVGAFVSSPLRFSQPDVGPLVSHSHER